MNRKTAIVIIMVLLYYILNYISVPGECALDTDNSIKTDSVVVLKMK